MDFFQRARSAFFKFLQRFNRKKLRFVRGKKQRRSVLTERTGRNIKIREYVEGENTIAPLQSIMNAVSHGVYDLKQKVFHIRRDDFVGWERLEHESLTLILVVDVSRSTFTFVNAFADIINSLTSYFRMHKDRIGLISLQGTQAKILNHPTHNYRIITKNLLRMRIYGDTPLADGLFKALAMVRLEKQRKPGCKNIVILLSDCYPEPVSGKHDDLFDEPAYRDTIRAAVLYAKNSVSLLVINPGFQNKNKEDFSPGERLATIIEQQSQGRLIRLYRASQAYYDDPDQPPTQREIQQIIGGLEEILGERRTPQGVQHYYH